MARDYDITTGSDINRPSRPDPSSTDKPRAVEHVYFKDPESLFKNGATTVEIGMRVHNYSQSSSLSTNEFDIVLFNKYGYQLWPVPGKSTIEH